MSSASSIAPAARNIAYTSGDAWPLEKMRWSFASTSGRSKS